MSAARQVGDETVTPIRRLLRGPRFHRRQLPALAVAVAVLLVAATVAGAAIKDFLQPRPFEPRVLRVTGSIKMSNSRAGTAIVSIQRMEPGDHVDGTVRIGNRSRVQAHFWLKKVRLVDRPGPSGGRLSRRLVLQVMRLYGSRPPRVLYRGSIADMPTLYLGKFRPRHGVTYRFTVSFPDHGARYDNLYQGSGVSVGFRWYASRAR